MAARRRCGRNRRGCAEVEEAREVVIPDDETKLADALETIGSQGESPEPHTEEREPETAPAPRIEIEAFSSYRDRIAADTDGRLAEMMMSYANALPPEQRERLETDVDTFISVWDKFAAAFPPPQPAQEQEPPPPPREIIVPEWRVREIEKMARVKESVINSCFVVPPGMMPDESIGSRREAEKYNREVAALRQRVREGDQDAEYLLASKLFPKGLKPND